MDLTIRMSLIIPAGELPASSASASRSRWPPVRVATALEVLLVYSGILLYIWRWQVTRPGVWMALLACVLLSHVMHRDTLGRLGLSLRGLRANAEFVLPVMAALYVALALFGFARHALVLLLPVRQSLPMFASYFVWAAVQQYLAQSYFHNRLMSVIGNRGLSSALVAVMFGGAHIPNPILMVATTAMEFIFSWAFARHRNIWPLALAHAAGGFLIAAISPPSLMHNMRVGPGYFFFHRRP